LCSHIIYAGTSSKEALIEKLLKNGFVLFQLLQTKSLASVVGIRYGADG
jgi:hypothetical protein